jgi:hypothetical protein
MSLLILRKATIHAYTKRDGTFVRQHQDKRRHASKKGTVSLIHRASTDKLKISPDTPHWIFDQCVFFSGAAPEGASTAEIAEESYSQGDGKHLYVLQVPGTRQKLIIGRGGLEPDARARDEIQELWGDDIDVHDLLTGRLSSAEDEIEDGGWHIQRIRAQLARRMGYLAVADRDEQGEVLIVDFAGRNDELNKRWRYLGDVSNVG